MITANEPASERYLSPHPSVYQNTPTGSFYNRSSSGSSPSLDPDAPLDRRRKQAPEGGQVGVDDRKGKKTEQKAATASSSTQDHGLDPLEIAYGPTIGTHTQITEDDFQVDTETGPHKPQKAAEGGGRLSPGQMPKHESPVREESGPWDSASEAEEGSKKDDHYGVGGAEEFQNVWGR